MPQLKPYSIAMIGRGTVGEVQALKIEFGAWHMHGRWSQGHKKHAGADLGDVFSQP
jgi:hypothetical protein